MSIAATFEIEYLQYLDADGKLVRDDLPAFARDVKQLVELYKLMLFVRVFDGKAIALQRTGKLGTYASCLGHEAAHVAIGSAMQEDDVFAPMYREYGAQFVRGVKPREVLLYWGGDERGNDFSGPAHDFAWCVPIATQCLHGAGAALAFKIRKEPRVAVTVVGDGGSSKADFYGAINVTGAMQLPLVVACRDHRPSMDDDGADRHQRDGVESALGRLSLGHRARLLRDGDPNSAHALSRRFNQHSWGPGFLGLAALLSNYTPEKICSSPTAGRKAKQSHPVARA